MPTPAEVVAYFVRQREDCIEKFLEGFDKNKFSPKQIRRAGQKMQVSQNGKPCRLATPVRLYVAKTLLKKNARELRNVDPRKIVSAVAVHCQLEPLPIARYWPEIAAQIANETLHSNR